MVEAMGRKCSWEKEVRERIELWHTNLPDLAGKEDIHGLQVLKLAVDAQLALAELKVKSRQADWAKTTTWAPLVLPMVGAIIGGLIAGWVKH
jgi:hypothetical protein